ncbi:unnamed protein product, partial [Didymodactylos carnosus]
CQQQAEDLYLQLTDKKRKATSVTINKVPTEVKRLKELFHIDFNKESSNAVVLASKTVQQWLKKGCINFNGKPLFKTCSLTWKLILKPILSTAYFSQQLLETNPIFQNSVKSIRMIDDTAIVELTDRLVYENCLQVGSVQIKLHNKSQVMKLQIEPYSPIGDPTDNDINVENWYGTKMKDCKPDITQFEPTHQIFRYKWNSKVWLEEFHKTKGITNRQQQNSIRHLLRVTTMLNTMATVKSKKYQLENSDRTEIELHSSPLKTTLYNHQSTLFQSFEKQTIQTPFDSTRISVQNIDCLVVYEQLVNGGHKPLLLNMANATSPGGGYRKGDGAQEENLFRRSNYYLSLDYMLDTTASSQSERFKWSSNCKLENMSQQQLMYPMDEFAAIYTSGITVFRDIEDKGYPYLSVPLYNVKAIAMAAYRDPPLQNGRLEITKAVGTLLSALGCGAFKNPPQHVALIFKSVIEQYAGFFKQIIFAIVNDHNTGSQLNPDGNFTPFKDALDGLTVQPSTEPSVGMMIGPYRINNKKKNNDSLMISEFVIGEKSPCRHAANCKDINDQQHCRQFTHPPLCPYGTQCHPLDNDDVHSQFFLHLKKCSAGSECTQTDQKHLRDYVHPDYCAEEGYCTKMSKSHLKQYRHVPLCRNSLNCKDYLRKTAEHCQAYRHCKLDCQFGYNCINFHNPEHFNDEIHPFKVPCPLTPFSCKQVIDYIQKNDNRTDRHEKEKLEMHCLKYSHVCPWGRQCRDINDKNKHLQTAIHIARNFCPYDNKCQQLNDEDHLNSFTHLNIRDLRLLCKFSGTECENIKDLTHLAKYRHNINQSYLGVAQFFDLNKNINFVQNYRDILHRMKSYVTDVLNENWSNIRVDDKILKWIRSLQPIHRCNVKIFESILVHGHVMGKSYMDKLKHPMFVAHTSLQHSRIRKILNPQGDAVQKQVKEFIKAIVELEFIKAKFNTDGDQEQRFERNEQGNVYVISTHENSLKYFLSENDIKTIKYKTIEIARDSIKLNQNQMGIGYNLDIELGTNQHVFSILGPHTGHYYGDIVIVFKPELMLHPDSNFTIQAATTFLSGNTHKSRPWLKDLSTRPDRLKQFHSAKLHC